MPARVPLEKLRLPFEQEKWSADCRTAFIALRVPAESAIEEGEAVS